jgi:hypothetical protein
MKIRRKLENDSSCPTHFRTIPHLGYWFTTGHEVLIGAPTRESELFLDYEKSGSNASRLVLINALVESEEQDAGRAVGNSSLTGSWKAQKQDPVNQRFRPCTQGTTEAMKRRGTAPSKSAPYQKRQMRIHKAGHSVANQH